MEGIGQNHAHMKIYPMHGLNRKYRKIIHPETAYFETYPGYITSFLGPRARKEDLEKIFAKLKRS